jgi:hypothetical protein
MSKECPFLLPAPMNTFLTDSDLDLFRSLFEGKSVDKLTKEFRGANLGSQRFNMPYYSRTFEDEPKESLIIL